MPNSNKYQVAIVGGAGHVGAPLGLVFADRGKKTLLYDINQASLDLISSGNMPFIEEGGPEMLARVLENGMLGTSSDPAKLAGIPYIVITIGTPIDEFHNPTLSLLSGCIDQIAPYLSEEQTLVLRSTVSPGVTEYLSRYLKSAGIKCSLSFCPERVIQGHAIKEILTLPQFISGTTERALEAARELFKDIVPEVIDMTPTEAEYAKLVTNSYRYMNFALTNQLYMVVESAGVDYNQLIEKMKRNYPRMFHIPKPGFTAGPCLMKDTMQLFAFGQHNFLLGKIAVQVNEGLPNFMVEQLSKQFELKGLEIGILGMAFKSDSDDIRDSLSYKLRKILEFSGASVTCSDEYVKDPQFVSRECLIEKCKVLIIGAPHKAYRDLEFPVDKFVVDIWNSRVAKN